MTAPVCRGWDGHCREGAHPRLGVPQHPRARRQPQLPPVSRSCHGALRTWLPQLPLQATTWSEPQPGGYFWLCITSQLTLPPLLPRTPTHDHPRTLCTCVCPHRARLPWPPVPHVPAPCQPPASPRPCQHSPSPHIRAAGGDAWRLQSRRLSHGVESCQPSPCAAAWVPSAWGALLWPLASTELPGRSHRAFGIK